MKESFPCSGTGQSVILCSFTEGAGRNLLNQRKSRHELGILEGPGEKQGHMRET